MDRKLWTAEEDQHIIRLVAKFGTKKWPMVSERLCAQSEFQRTGKQCRQRWYNHLSPEISSVEWSQEDQERLFQSHKLYGNKWKVISQLFVGRTDNAIKNHFYSTIRRCLRRINKLQGEKNSTLKMRAIKPYVLSKILADRNLTETILELGKIKPNKARIEVKREYLEQFNEMIAKLYTINDEYETMKRGNKKEKKEQNGTQQQQNQDGDNQSSSSEEEDIESIDNSGECKSKQSKKQRMTKIELLAKQSKEKADDSRSVQSSPSKSNPLRVSPKKQQRIRRKSSKIVRTQVPLLQQFKQLKLNQGQSRRNRTPINYLKLNDGILCENNRHDIIEDTCNESQQRSRRQTMTKLYCGSEQNISLEEKLFGSGSKLEEIMEVEEKYLQKEHLSNGEARAGDHFSENGEHSHENHRYLQSYEEMEARNAQHYEIANPSPCFARNFSIFDELVVIGTQLKIMTTPRSLISDHESRQMADSLERKKSQQNFIEQILEINFDPEFVMHYGEDAIVEEEEKDQKDENE